MTDELKQQLFSHWAYYKSPELLEGYEGLTPEEFAEKINESPEDVETLAGAFSQVPDEELEAFISELQEKQNQDMTYQEAVVSAKNGAKVEYLKKLKESKAPKKKCKCGCEMKSFKEGGKVIEKCGCGCKTEAKKCGGSMKKKLIKKGQEGIKTKYDPKKPYSKTNFDGNAYNKYLDGMTKASIDSVQTYNRKNPNSETDKRNAKQILKDLRSGKSKL